MQIRLGLPFVCGDESHIVRWTPPPAVLTLESPEAYIALCGPCARRVLEQLRATLEMLPACEQERLTKQIKPYGQ